MTTQLILPLSMSRPIRSTAQVERRDRDAGIACAVAAMPDKGYDMDELRRWARWFVHSNQSMRMIGVPNVVWADPVRQHFNIRTLAGRGNAFMGDLFKVGFEPTGERIKSKTAGSHGNDIRLWRVKKPESLASAVVKTDQPKTAPVIGAGAAPAFIKQEANHG